MRMDASEIRLAQARWVLGSLRPEELVDLAGRALEAGFDSPALRVLAGEARPTRPDAQPLWARALSELGLDPLDEEQARLVVAASWARAIASGEIGAYEGASAIARECCDLMGRRSRLDVFAIQASRIEDFRFAASESSDPGGYDRLVAECEDEILREAKRLLSELAS